MFAHETVCDEDGGWRGTAVSLALEKERGGVSGFYALFREIRRECPHRVTMEATIADIFQTMRFLGEETGVVRDIFGGKHLAFADFDGGTTRPSLAWWIVGWKGSEFEVVLYPQGGRFGNVVVISREAAVAEAFLREVAEYAQRPSERAMIHSHGWRDAPELEAEVSATGWNDIVLEKRLLADIRDSIEGFTKHREAFHALGFPWRRGVLLVGPPGTGKTMVIKAAAAALPKMPFLYVRDLNPGRAGAPIRNIFERARRIAPAILVFEDLDGLITDGWRSNFLNELDGLDKNEGLLVLASSNHPERIDPALLNRPSRFDRLFHIGPPARAERFEYASLLLGRYRDSGTLSEGLDADSLSAEIAENSAGFTPSHIKEVILSAALGSAQRGETLLGEIFALEVARQIEEIKKHVKRANAPEKLALERGGLPPGFRYSETVVSVRETSDSGDRIESR